MPGAVGGGDDPDKMPLLLARPANSLCGRRDEIASALSTDVDTWLDYVYLRDNFKGIWNTGIIPGCGGGSSSSGYDDA